ncbi:apolipoprotein D [Trichogramma pretiosum]|uniref:apolipoprotein D n=1 Tax=Trichogramma pretiosum TaxID=7493 RepID=UPI0006C9E07C|nr:apolipoprotein D [Trichogramma pretiosum]
MILSLGCDALASVEAVVSSRARANDMLYLNFALALSALLVLLRSDGAASWKKRDDKTRCPRVKAMRNFNVTEFLGSWNVVQYYASSEEAITYRCMRAELSVMPESAEVTMNFTYSFADDPINEQLVGNITWTIPAPESPAHWVHAEKPYEGVYNTYILDSDYQSWALLMHCAEKSKTPRYLSSFIMSRKTNLTNNVITYLREKLPRYNIDLEYMFSMDQSNCTTLDPVLANSYVPPSIIEAKQKTKPRRHPLKRKNKREST